MIVKINETLELIYTFMPQEIFIIIMAGLVFLLYEFFKGRKEKWINQKSKRN
jgi:hypothetical protein